MSSSTHTTTAHPQSPVQTPTLRVKTRLQAGGITTNHNETVLRSPRPAVGFKGTPHLKAGSIVIEQ